MKILVSSIGSLVGQNILDVLESEKCYRRDLVTIIGTNSIALNPMNFRCDKCYLLPNTAESEFVDKMIEIIKVEKPDLILSGRDEDTEALAKLMLDNPELPGRLPYGNIKTIQAALNKLKTWEFCQRNSLPFADTFVLGKTGDIKDFKDFIDKHSFPLIAKPIEGFASKGVVFARNEEEAMRVVEYENYMVQEYLGDGEKLKKYFEQYSENVPLFTSAPNIFHHSCHTIISPDGSIDEVFISRNEHENGVTVGFKRVYDEELESITKRYAEAVFKEGGYGPITVQLRKDVNGFYKAQEMNMRTNGNTYPRFLMGQDDLGLMINNLFKDKEFPIHKDGLNSSEFVIGKSLSSNVISLENVNKLKENKELKINE
ncbi:MAG: ATP-grasp domain-containing protein [Arcobacter sp.]|nr:ATP-grasp domain-containing protein [Arcobacter sp.]|tara:strand:- start:17770 stop:18885 length:1116 start_codon:yes stop_codon:yes gene_type:complete